MCREVQTSIADWCGLIRASGGLCRADKGYASIGSFKFTNGKATLKTVRSLPTNGVTAPDKKGKIYPSVFTIVNHHGRREKIALIGPGGARKTL